MKNINVYSSFPLLELGDFFSRQAIKPLSMQKPLDKISKLPSYSGVPKKILLKVEHELSLKEDVYIYGPFLTEDDHTPIQNIAEKFKAKINFTYIETSMDELFTIFKNKKGTLSYEHFLDIYEQAFTFPSKCIEKISFERI